MFRRNLLKRVLPLVLLVLVGMLVGVAFFTGNVGQLLKLTGPSRAQAPEASSSVPLLAPSDPAAPAAWHTCTSVGVAVYPSRIHVECSVAAGSIRFFALGTSNSAHTARVLSVLSMGHVTGKPLTIEYDPNDTSGTAIGCQANDCRLILSAAILP
jgi:hypothetical protein